LRGFPIRPSKDLEHRAEMLNQVDQVGLHAADG
jgi:hypothetical protein